MRHIYCHPLFDERKCAHRFSYDLEQCFRSKGIKLERFDYYGTGEAEGKFENVTLDSLRQDIHDRINGEKVCLIGLRFGASLAFDICRDNTINVKNIVLIEPVIDGNEYVQHMRRKQHIKNVMTGQTDDPSDDTGFENLGGYKTSSQFITQLMNFHMITPNQEYTSTHSISIMQISQQSKPNVEISSLSESLKHTACQVLVDNFKLAPCWERVPYMLSSQLMQHIMERCHD